MEWIEKLGKVGWFTTMEPVLFACTVVIVVAFTIALCLVLVMGTWVVLKTLGETGDEIAKVFENFFNALAKRIELAGERKIEQIKRSAPVVPIGGRATKKE